MTVPPAGSYELSIYGAYPPIFWMGLFGLVILYGSLIIFDTTRILKFLSIYGGLSLYALLLSLPGARGYFIPERYDVLVHIGDIKDILLHGKIGTDNFYPLMHILAAQIKYIANFSISSTLTYLPVIVYLLFAPYVYILAKQLAPNNNSKSKQNQIVLLATFLAILNTSTPYLVPSMVSFVLAVLILGVWLSSIGHMKKMIVTLILYTSLVFYHPLTSIYLTFTLLIVDVISLTCRRSNIIKWNTKFYKLAPIILIIWFIWYLSFYKIQISLVLLGKR